MLFSPHLFNFLYIITDCSILLNRTVKTICVYKQYQIIYWFLFWWSGEDEIISEFLHLSVLAKTVCSWELHTAIISRRTFACILLLRAAYSHCLETPLHVFCKIPLLHCWSQFPASQMLLSVGLLSAPSR